jgi:hypothetical protein
MLAMLDMGTGEIIMIMFALIIFLLILAGVAGVIYWANRPPSATPPLRSALPSEMAATHQRQRDIEQTRLLAIFHFVFAGFALLGIGFLIVHYFFVHTFMAHPFNMRSQMPTEEILGLLNFVYFGAGLCILMGLVLNGLSGWFLLKKRNRMFSLIISGLNCLQIPFGTALGVFTIIVLSRDSVRELYEESPVESGQTR